MSWNGSTGANAPKKVAPKAPMKIRGLIALVLVVIVGAGVLWYVTQPSAVVQKHADEKREGVIKAADRAPLVQSQTTNAVRSVRKRSKQPEPVERTVEQKKILDEVAKLQKSVVADFRVDPAKFKPVFTNDVLCQLQLFVNPGEDMPPPDPVTDEEARAAIKEGVRVEVGDSPEVLAIKKTVHHFLGLLDNWLKEGGTAESFFAEMSHEQAMDAEAVETVRSEVEELQESGDIEGAKGAAKKLNKFLADKGLPPVVVKGVNSEFDVSEEEAKKENTKESNEETDL